MADKQDDLSLPSAVITRIIKDALPEGCSVAKEAKLAVARAASVFVLYITAQANTVAAQKNRKTITNNDVLEALQITEFGRFEAPLIEALAQFTQEQKEKKEKKLNNSTNNKPDGEEEQDEVEMEDPLDITT